MDKPSPWKKRRAAMSYLVPNPVLTDRFTQAFAFVSIIHAAQARDGTSVPYLSHVLGVASLVLEHGADEDTAIAALLHDAPACQGGYAMLAQIRARFGERVASIVERCTDSLENPKPGWSTRKVQYLAQLSDTHGGADLAVCQVAVADKLHNARAMLRDLRNIGAAVFDRFSATQEQVGWFYGSAAQVLHRRLSGEPAISLAGALLHALDEIAAHKGCETFGAGVEGGFHGKPCPDLG
jgi:(p)ppGpp synthase/HD superfamily hydrolase